MSQPGSSPTTAGGQLVNPPSVSTVVAAYLKGLVLGALSVSVILLLFRGLRGLTLSGFLTFFALLGGLWLLVTVLATLSEPVMFITPDAIAISSWGARLFHANWWRRYPMQPLNPELRRGGRGGSYIRMYVRDASGYQHRVIFHFAGIDDLQTALMQAGCTVS